MKINQLEIDDVKRIKAVKLMPDKNGLTIIGGKNSQGKTSVLDSIAWALGGDDFRPSEPAREGSVNMPYLRVVLDNGIVVERKGKNSSLKVTDPSGHQAGQQLLNSFISKLALNLPKFMEANDREKADTLLNIIGVGQKLRELEEKEKSVYQTRLAIGRIADQKKKFADEQPYFPDAPDEPVSASELIRQQQEILARNGENQRKRDRLQSITYEKYRIADEASRIEAQIADLQEKLAERRKAYEETAMDEETAMKSVAELVDESTAELEANIRGIDEINRKVRANLDKDKALADAKDYRDQYDAATAHLNELKAEKTALLDHADLPLPDLSVKEGKLTYKGQYWDNMSGSERLKVATAVVRKLNPECGFVLVDKLEQMDMDTLREFGEWAEAENLQIIGTKVSTGDECSIIIEDGYGSNVPTIDPKHEEPKFTWTEGQF